MAFDKIEYVSSDGYKGILYNCHEWYGEQKYEMSVRDSDGYEVLHTYNATPKTAEELKKVVDGHGSMRFILEDLAMEMAEPEIEGGGSTWWHVCGECHGAIDASDNFCRHCGRRIKHEEKAK